MIRAALFSLLVSAVLSTRAQAFHPFLDHSEWYVNAEGAQISSFDWYQIGRDSTIGGQDFREVFVNAMSTGVLVREDTSQRKVWIASAWDGYSERLLYDFGLNVGDTTTLVFRHSGTKRFVVTQIDAVNTTQGFVPRINLDNIDGGLPASIRWGQGIGEDDHPFYLDLTGVADPDYHLICNYHDGFKFFDDGFGNCPQSPPPPLAADEKLLEDPGIRIWPNPVRDVLKVEVPAGKGNWKVELFDFSGKKVKASELRAGSVSAFVLKGLPQGLYFVRIGKGLQSFSYEVLNRGY